MKSKTKGVFVLGEIGCDMEQSLGVSVYTTLEKALEAAKRDYELDDFDLELLEGEGKVDLDERVIHLIKNVPME